MLYTIHFGWNVDANTICTCFLFITIDTGNCVLIRIGYTTSIENVQWNDIKLIRYTDICNYNRIPHICLLYIDKICTVKSYDTYDTGRQRTIQR